ncbi:uncharacterized protein LOC661310 [Tribolium castaneum]
MTFLTIVLCLLPLTFGVSKTFDLTVLHINDFHARFEETNDEGGSCKSDQCIGGFSRTFNVINQSLTQHPDSILLNAGDNFQGTLWYNFFKWNVTQYFLNELPFDAIVLGNHEFDDGIKGVVPFIKSLKAPVIASNIDDSQEPDLQNIYQKSVVVERNGKKIGIIGVLIHTCNEISNTEKLSFLDESESVNTEAERLVKEEGVFTNIVLSHSGYDIEQEIARKATKASKISLVVGGHSHTFLYTGEPVPGPATPSGPYPTIINRTEDDRQVLVVQASCYARYLGNITVSYDENGNCVGWSGEPIFLDTDTPQDKIINKELQPWKDAVDELGNRVLGQTLVTLDKTMCYQSECLLGNFVTDVMVYSYIALADNTSYWTYASLAVFNVGGLRTTIERGDITYSDMMTAQPFENTFDVGEIEGKYIKEMFEFSMTPYSYGRTYADVNLLQISGFHIVANLSQPIGSRIQSIKARCNECNIPIYEDLDLNKTYRLIVPVFLRNGGDGFTVIRDNLKNVKVGRVDIDVFVEYLGAKSPVFEEIDGRIEFVGDVTINCRNLDSGILIRSNYRLVCLKCCVVNYSIKFAMQTFLPIVLFLKIVLCAQFNLTIIHFNDFHARYEPVDNLSTTCEGDNCIGGFSRLYSKITQLKNETPNSLLLNAGDNFQGTLWYIVHKWNVTQHFLNKLPFDAITLGNHEFDDGIAGLVPYLNHIKAPVIVSNIDDSKEPRFQNLTRKSVIVEKGGKKIGIIGVLTTSTKLTSRTENLTFQNELESVNSEAKKLQELGVFTIIVLSHCGYEADLEIAQKSNFKISVIVGGHTDTFLYSGSPVPGPDKPSGPYPTPVLNINGGTVLVVQASAYTKYLGDLKVIYDELGNLTGWGGNPVFLGPETPSDGEIDAELEVWKKDVDLEGGKIVGNSKLAMRNKPCRSEECPLGNFATDAMVENNNTCNLAMIHAGGMRAGIETGNITFNQLISTFPFQDTINLCEIKGEHLVKILESCVDDNHLKWPHLFQVSGFKIVFNVSNPEGGRVQSVKTSCRECADPIYENLVLEKYYRVFLPTFLTDTDFNPLFKKYIRNKIIGDRDSDVYVRYLGKHSPLWARVEDRIKIVS